MRDLDGAAIDIGAGAVMRVSGCIVQRRSAGGDALPRDFDAGLGHQVTVMGQLGCPAPPQRHWPEDTERQQRAPDRGRQGENRFHPGLLANNVLRQVYTVSAQGRDKRRYNLQGRATVMPS